MVGHVFDHQAPLTRARKPHPPAPNRLFDPDILKTEGQSGTSGGPDWEAISEIPGPGSALRVTRWCFACELAMDERAARAASASRVSGAPLVNQMF